jgi:DNA-binding transcriptional regulator YdaS (Cro superfamily)
VSEFAQRFIGEREIAPGDVRALERAVEAEVKGRLEEVRSRMTRREKAVRENERVRRELEDLRLQRQAELRVLERMKGRK